MSDRPLDLVLGIMIIPSFLTAGCMGIEWNAMLFTGGAVEIFIPIVL